MGELYLTTFAARLNRLFDTVYPPGRGPYSGAEAIVALVEAGIKISAPYLSQLRSGNRTNPSVATMSALAKFFGVQPAYFTDDAYYTEVERELTWLDATRDEGLRRLGEGYLKLSPQARQDLEHRVEELLSQGD